MRWKRVLVIGAVAVVVGGAVAAGTALLGYHEATKIDRSNPKLVLSEYLQAALVRKDAVGADLYSCADKGRLAPVSDLRSRLDRRETDEGVHIRVEWGAQNRTDQGKDIRLTTDLSITAWKGVAVQSSAKETWRFTLVDDDGWRVCGAERLPSPPPTPTPTPTTTRSPAAP